MEEMSHFCRELGFEISFAQAPLSVTISQLPVIIQDVVFSALAPWLACLLPCFYHDDNQLNL